MQHFTWQTRASGGGQSPGTFCQLLSPQWEWRQQLPALIHVHPVPCRHGQPVLPGAQMVIPAAPPVVSSCISPAGGPLLFFSQVPLAWTSPSPQSSPPRGQRPLITAASQNQLSSKTRSQLDSAPCHPLMLSLSPPTCLLLPVQKVPLHSTHPTPQICWSLEN